VRKNQLGASGLLRAAGLGIVCVTASCNDELVAPVDALPGSPGSSVGASSNVRANNPSSPHGGGGDASGDAGIANVTNVGGAGGTGSGGSAPTTAGSDAAGGAAGAVAELEFVVDPTFVGNPTPSVPQAGVLHLETNLPAEVEVMVQGGGEEWTLTLPEATQFDHPILGVKPDTAYTLSVAASKGDAVVTAGPLAWTSPPLPDDFPTIRATQSEPSRMEPGMTLFSVTMESGGPEPIVIVDHAGVVRWYYLDQKNPAKIYPGRLPNGNHLFFRAACGVVEVDVLGNMVGAWHASEFARRCNPPSSSVPVPVPSLHHDIQLLPNGNLLSFSHELRTIENYPTSEDDPDAPTQTARVFGSVITEFTPEGNVVDQIPLFDLLDPTRVGRGSLSTGWVDDFVADDQIAYDWDHANAIVYDEASDAYYVSVRHQDAIVKISRSTHELLWILGTPANWKEPWQSKLLTPVGELEWFFHQHAVEVNALGLAFYDNGNYRAAAFEPPETEYSRGVIYEVDEVARSVEQVWSYGAASGDESFFSGSRGDTDWLPNTSNVLIVSGKVRGLSGSLHAEILEITPDGQRVFELMVGDASAEPVDPRSHATYRGQRIADIRQ